MLVIGPGMPYLDPAIQPCRLLAEHLTAPGAVIVGNGQLSGVTLTGWLK